MNTKTKHLPPLRFPEFTEPWKTGSVDSFVKRFNHPVAVEPECMYRQIGVRSHGKGIFHKEPVSGKSLGDKRVFWVHPQAFVVNIVFGWEQAVALTSPAEEGFIASHRFPMFVPVGNKTDLNFLLLFFLRKKGKYLLELASPGGAGRNKTLGQNEFAKLDVTLPTLPEQQKIASFIGVVDKKLEALRSERELLRTYKRGLMEKIFSQQFRFKRDDGSKFPDWKGKRLGEIASRINSGGTPSSDISRYWGGSCPWISGADFDNNNIKGIRRSVTDEGIKESSTFVASKGDLLLVTRTGVGKMAIAQFDVAVSQDITAMSFSAGIDERFVYFYFQSFKKSLLKSNQGTSINGIVRKDLVKVTISVPDIEEQKKIADFISVIDTKIDTVADQIKKTERFKKGLLQQMFV